LTHAGWPYQTTQDLKQPRGALDLVDDRETAATRLQVTARIRQLVEIGRILQIQVECIV
jgi:hypothetical protein